MLEEDHYWPFGLTMNITPMQLGVNKNSIKFQSQQHEDDFGINMYSFKYREHDPQIGRFWQIDPLAEKYVYNSTYAFSENKVTSHVELEGLESLSIHVRSFISAKETYDPLNRKFDGDNRKATVSENATSRGRAIIDYDYPTDNATLRSAYANETVRHNVFGDGTTRAVGKVSGTLDQTKVNDEKYLMLHYETQNPLTPESLTPTVDFDGYFGVEYDKGSNSWNLNMVGMSDGYPSTETFIEDPSGQRIMLGYGYESGTPGKQLFGNADTKAFDVKATVNLDENYNFKNATLQIGDKTYNLSIVPSK